MKIFLVVVALCLCALNVKAGPTKAEMVEKFRADSQDCVVQTGATADDLEEIIKHLPASSMNAKCLRACIMKKHGSMHPDGKLSVEMSIKIAEFVHQNEPDKVAIASEVIKACEAIAVSADHCEASEEYMTCFKKEGEARGISCDEF